MYALLNSCSESHIHVLASPVLYILFYFSSAGKRERVDFAQTVTKYDRRFKVCWTWQQLNLSLALKFICISDPVDTKARPVVITTVHLPHWQREGKFISFAFHLGGIVQCVYLAPSDQEGSDERSTIGGDQEKDPYRQTKGMFSQVWYIWGTVYYYSVTKALCSLLVDWDKLHNSG